jgi:hypothetical protein
MSCPDCGEELDDFAPCACTLGLRRVDAHRDARSVGARGYTGEGMRAMVARKLARKAAKNSGA